MYKKLEELNRLNNAMDKIVADVDRCNKELESEYKQHEETRLNEFMESMNELAGYAKNLSSLHFVTDIVLNVKHSSYGDHREILIFDFEKDGNFIIQTNWTDHDACIYASKFAGFDKTRFISWKYGSCGYFECGWGYYYNRASIDEHKKFIAVHASEILDTIQKMIEDKFDKEIKAKANKACKEQSRLIVDIERVKK